MRVITWNVNSIKQRLPRLLALLDRHAPDVVCLQETKTIDQAFPFAELSAAGYHALSYGQRAYNGVAILSRDPIEEISRGMPDDPIPGEARLLAARTDRIAVASVYAVNGKAVGDPAYEVKLAWYDALRVWAMETFDPREPYVLAGDFNVAPEDRDIHDPNLWQGKNHASPPERDRIQGLLDLGLVDLGRAGGGEGPGLFTWWDYRMGAFHRGWGLRIDLLLGSGSVAERLASVVVDRDERKPTSGEGKPSDHAPVILTLRD
jgi:exodeoxyribonuclease-3